MVEVVGGDRRIRKGVCEAVSKWTTANSNGSIAVLIEPEGKADV